MSGDESVPPPGGVDFREFHDNRWEELRKAFSYAKLHGIDPDVIVQKTMTKAERRCAEFATEVDLVKWCKVVGRRMIAAEKKRAHRQHEEPHADPHVYTPASAVLDVAEMVTGNADMDRLLARLTPRHEKVLRLAAKGLTRADIAAEFGISPGAAGQLLYRARKKFRAIVGRLVATLLALVGIRRSLKPQPSHAQTAVAGAMSACVMLALVLPAPGDRALSGRTTDPSSALATVIGHAVGDVAAVVGRVGARTHRATAPATTTDPSTQAKAEAPTGLVPHVPSACAPGVCIGSCPNRPQAGDRIYPKVIFEDPCTAGSSESVAPVCQYVTDNPVIGCHRDGDPQWVVDPPPPPSPEGAPL